LKNCRYVHSAITLVQFLYLVSLNYFLCKTGSERYSPGTVPINGEEVALELFWFL